MANQPYIQAVDAVISNCPVFRWGWLGVYFLDKETQCASLMGIVLNQRYVQVLCIFENDQRTVLYQKNRVELILVLI